jgi:subtilisin family serine protease
MAQKSKAKQKKDKPLLGEGETKIQPKLRVVANGSASVNEVRAVRCGAIAIDSSKPEPVHAPPGGVVPLTAAELDLPAKRGKLNVLARNVYANVFIQMVRTDANITLEGENARRGNIATAKVDFRQLDRIANDPNVAFIEIGANLNAPNPEVNDRGVKPPAPERWRFGLDKKHKFGADVLIGIIDVQGFDFSHPDFLDKNGNTRFMRIWDQGGDVRPSPHSRDRRRMVETFDYGSEIMAEHMNAAIRNASKFGLPAYELEPQSQMVPSSHGTHVASIAAGNRGVASRAALAGVSIALPEEEAGDLRRNFFDSTRLAHAVDYLISLAKQMKLPVAINISLGTNGHAHDGSGALNRWIDSAVSVPGRCVCVAAGNAGQEVAEFEGDYGYVLGRIHTSGRIPARGLMRDIEWIVVGNGIADISENELEIWYSSQDLFSVSVRPPKGDWIGPVSPKEYVENKQLPDRTMVSVYNEVFNPANGANCISIYLSPFFRKDAIVGVPAGTWTVRLQGVEVKDGGYHGWIERDDPIEIGRIGDDKAAWRFPSFFSETSMVDDSTVSSLGCGFRTLSVANLDEARETINKTSSQGPTRDGRNKPDVAAPGTEIVAANGFAESEWVAMTGTSMASPFVTGVVGLMLGVNPNLTAAQIEGIVQTTARPLSGSDYTWRNNAGFGRLDPGKCLEAAASINDRKEIKR